jgi:hypothetical protein
MGEIFGEDSFSKKPGQEEEEGMPGNQLALFRLWLRRLPERLPDGGDERREATRKRLTCTSGLLLWILVGLFVADFVQKKIEILSTYSVTFLLLYQCYSIVL